MPRRRLELGPTVTSLRPLAGLLGPVPVRPQPRAKERPPRRRFSLPHLLSESLALLGQATTLHVLRQLCTWTGNLQLLAICMHGVKHACRGNAMHGIV